MQRGVACKVAVLDAWKTLLQLEFGSNCVCSLQGDPTSQRCPLWWGGGGGEGGGGVGWGGAVFMCLNTWQGRGKQRAWWGVGWMGWQEWQQAGRSGSRQAGVAAGRQMGRGWGGMEWGRPCKCISSTTKPRGGPGGMLGSTRAWGKQESKAKTVKNGAFLGCFELPAHNHGEFRRSEHKLLSSMVENGGEGLHL